MRLEQLKADPGFYRREFIERDALFVKAKIFVETEQAAMVARAAQAVFGFYETHDFNRVEDFTISTGPGHINIGKVVHTYNIDIETLKILEGRRVYYTDRVTLHQMVETVHGLLNTLMPVQVTVEETEIGCRVILGDPKET